MVERLNCQNYTQVVKRLKMSTLYTSDENGKKCQHYTHVVKRFKMSTVYTSDENVKHVIIMHE